MQKPVVVWLGAMLCCFLWGSAFPCIKIGVGDQFAGHSIADSVRGYAVFACRHTGNRAWKYA